MPTTADTSWAPYVLDRITYMPHGESATTEALARHFLYSSRPQIWAALGALEAAGLVDRVGSDPLPVASWIPTPSGVAAARARR